MGFFSVFFFFFLHSNNIKNWITSHYDMRIHLGIHQTNIFIRSSYCKRMWNVIGLFVGSNFKEQIKQHFSPNEDIIFYLYACILKEISFQLSISIQLTVSIKYTTQTVDIMNDWKLITFIQQPCKQWKTTNLYHF